MSIKKEKHAMPDKTVEVWHLAATAFQLYWPNLFYATCAFMIVFLRGIYSGAKWKRSLLEGGVIFFFAISTTPAAVLAGVPVEYAGAVMATVAAIGLDLSRERLLIWVDKLLRRWLGKA